MSLKRCLKVLISILFQSKEKKEKYTTIPIKDFITEISFYDISNYFPSKYFILENEPIYALYRTIQRKDIIILKSNTNLKEELIYILTSLFINKKIGKKNIKFEDFSGVVASRDNRKISFEQFKQDWYNDSQSKTSLYKFDNYNNLKKDVFIKNVPGDWNPIKNAYYLKYSDKYYANNSNKSHRFGILCKYNELNNLHDSEMFDVSELSINEQAKKLFLIKFYGFFINSKTADDIVKKYYDSVYSKWINYSLYQHPTGNEIVLIIFEKSTTPENVIQHFLNTKNAIFINTLLENTK